VNLTFQHLPFEKIADLAEGRLLADERDAAQAHLSGCSRCSTQLTQMEQTLNLMRTDAAEDAPRDVLFSVVNMFASRAAAKEPSLVRRVLAALSFDSAQLTPAYGVRSGQAVGRQMLFSAGDNDLDLRLQPSGEAWVVSGQVLGECTPGGRVELAGTDTKTAAELNELCEFTLPAVPSGSYTLRLRLSDVEVEIPELQLMA
jgi:anti-sigma factor RsiW